MSLSLVPVAADVLSDIDDIVAKANELEGQGRGSEAELELHRALSYSNSKLGIQSSASAGLCRRLAAMYLESNRFTEAERYLRRALVITTGYGPVASTAGGDFIGVSVYINDALQHPQNLTFNFMTADVLTLYAELFSKQGRYSDAARLLKQVVKVYEQREASLTSSPNPVTSSADELLADALVKLGSCLARQSEYNEAETVLKRAIEVTRNARGTYSKESAQAMKALSGLYRAQGRQSDAQTLDQEIEEIKQRTLN